jgi:hypothetical protein
VSQDTKYDFLKELLEEVPEFVEAKNKKPVKKRAPKK